MRIGNKLKKHNLHIHSTYSDGIHSPEEIVKVAKQFQLSKIGICDHGFSKKLPASKQITDRLEQ
ncbi:MAG: PHP domain-containing protein [Candidatus Hodarchaeota archaeon]